MSELVLAVPSKGRLEEQTRAYFADARLAIARPGGARSYSGSISAQPGIVVRFFPAGEIARELQRGTIDMGVTGADLIHESAENGADNVVFAHALGFGAAEVVVAVPDAWIDVVNMSDLADVASDFRARHGRWLRVASKYVNLTRKHFSSWGIAEYRIVESGGATESAPAAGAADLIVDITTTGSTLAANGLRVLEDGLILKSEANLVISKAAKWNSGRQSQLEDFLEALGVDSGIAKQL